MAPGSFRISDHIFKNWHSVVLATLSRTGGRDSTRILGRGDSRGGA